MKDPKDDADNHANQLNPNNDAFWQSRGYEDEDDYRNKNEDDNDDGSYLSESD